MGPLAVISCNQHIKLAKRSNIAFHAVIRAKNIEEFLSIIGIFHIYYNGIFHLFRHRHTIDMLH